MCGYLRTESGVGTAVRNYIRALDALRAPLSLVDLSDLQGNRSEDRTLTRFAAEPAYDVNLVCADVELHFAILSHLGEGFFRDRYSVGIWAWELPRFPEKWYDRFAYYDEIWVGTSFIANMLAPISPIPVIRIPPVLTPAARGSRERGRRRLGLAPEELACLFVFDFHSHLARKNPLALVDAFRMAFAPTDAARLVIKCVNEAANPAGYAELRRRARGYPIQIHAGYWTAEEVSDLMAACDAYVSLHRSEGTGLTITDAMALGKPVIATAWSGNMDFMTALNSFPVRYELVEIEETVGPYRAGEVWAEPSVEHAAELMRFVFENRREAETRGRAARREIESGFSAEPLADLVGRRLGAIGVRRRFADFQRERRAAYRAYQQLADRVREVVRATLPADATVLVVSKGDSDLVQLEGRSGWHFPRADDGAYAGYYPADSAAAVEHLEALRARGGEYFLLPSTAGWWLEHYGGLREHLDAHYREIARRDDACVIYAPRETTR